MIKGFAIKKFTITYTKKFKKVLIRRMTRCGLWELTSMKILKVVGYGF